MSEIEKIYFFGNNYKVVQILDDIAEIKHIICEKKSFNTDIYDYAMLYSIKFSAVEKRRELEAVLPKHTKAAVGISYGFGIIFKNQHINKFKYGIWNIHTGELPENRGRHPISWSFIKGHKSFGLAIHEINEEIDKGYLLGSTLIKRDLKDTETEIENKIISELESGLIITAMDNYFAGNKHELAEGFYSESLAHKYDNIDILEHSAVFLFNLFKSQAKHGGIIVNGKKYVDCVFYNSAYPESYKDYDLFTSKNGEIIGLR